ncbi:MAG: transposase domain-containing protein, partial [Gammaproteobacteria bacterium]
MPAHAVAYYVMALSLYRGVNTEEVLRVVTEGMEYLGAPAIRREVGKSGISAARSRLGAEVMQHIAERALVPLAEPQTSGAFYRDLRVVTLDGSTLEVADEAVNRNTFGVPGTQQGRTGYPQLRVVGLLENGTHVLFGVALGGYKKAEISLAHRAVQYLKPGMLCLADRGLSGYPLWQAAMQSGAQLLWRI